MEKETAIKILKELHDKSLFAERTALETIIPELKESWDERIRKELIFYLGDMPEDTELRNGVTNRDVLVWLEKQKSVRETVERCKNSWYNEGKIDGMAEGLTNDERYQQGWHDALEKQGEQKPILDFKASNWYVSKVDGKIHDMTYNPTYKVEPKFKVGDFIVNDYCMGRIIEITNDAYLLDTEQGIPFSCEHNVHLWTIQDAIDGDVLVNGSNIFVFHFTNETRLMGYCHVNVDDMQFYNDIGKNECFCLIDAEVSPATKEQRDLLFQKMKEAGYQWDDEKKELKLLITNGGDFEPKQEWSEEDDKIYYSLLADIRTRQDDSTSTLEAYYNEQIDWLKSLKDRVWHNSWKPSEEQLDELVNVITEFTTGEQFKQLNSLYEHLIKL